METFKICCLTYGKLDLLVRDAIQKVKDPELEFSILEGLGENLLERVREEVNSGADVILGGGANARIVRGYFDTPVVEFKITAIDYLNAIDKAFTIGRNIGITTYKNPITGELAQYIERLGLRVCNIIYNKVEDLRTQIEQSSCNVIVGAAHAVEVASELGKAGVLIYPGEEAIVNSFYQAKSVVQEVRKSNLKAVYTRAVVDHSTNGLILIDPMGRILEANRSAQGMVGKKELRTGGKLSEILPGCRVDQFIAGKQSSRTDMFKLNGAEVLQTWVRMTTANHSFIGAVGILSKAAEFNRAQLEYLEKQRHGTAQGGFTAKYRFDDIVGNCSEIRELIEEARTYAESDSSVLVYGETGVGKELFAQSLHNASVRKENPFIAINCAALPENLLESELFGYDDGAFTGGRKGGKKGLFELANGGTLFLDEIGELSPALQARLLRVLQEKEIMHIGGDRVIPVDVRMISATNRDLYGEEKQGFRRDLLYRLNVLELRIPPLKDRGNDAWELFCTFCERISPSQLLKKIPDTVREIVQLYSWPGNIRELQNIAERFVLHLRKNWNGSPTFCRQCMIKAIGEEQLCRDMLRPEQKNGEPSAKEIDKVCELLSFSREQVAQKLGISRTTMWRMVKRQEDKNSLKELS